MRRGGRFFFIINSYQVDPERADTAIVCTPTKSAHKRSLNTGVRHTQEQKEAGVPSELSGKCEEPHLVRIEADLMIIAADIRRRSVIFYWLCQRERSATDEAGIVIIRLLLSFIMSAASRQKKNKFDGGIVAFYHTFVRELR